ncbi:MAG: lysophospholipid acyltransferase family protein [Pseudomonadota bacterium]
MQILRSLAFNIFYFGFTICCLLFLNWLLLTSRPYCMAWVRWYLRTIYRMERWILGLDYQVVGQENMPPYPFLVAAKHQSLWETMKLHLIFDDPAVILKRELMKVPIWGWFAKKSKMIAVDRGAGGKAISSMIEGGRETVADGRPIVIFPQGTRVAPDGYKPYKVGIFALYEALNLPVLPMALNSGVFWQRRAFRKRSGTITVELLPPIEPGLDRETFMRRLETELEAASTRLVAEAHRQLGVESSAETNKTGTKDGGLL